MPDWVAPGLLGSLSDTEPGHEIPSLEHPTRLSGLDPEYGPHHLEKPGHGDERWFVHRGETLQYLRHIESEVEQVTYVVFPNDHFYRLIQIVKHQEQLVVGLRARRGTRLQSVAKLAGSVPL